MNPGLTERNAFTICLNNDLLSPIYYSTSRRDGCAICPNASPHELQKYVNAYPDAKNILLEIFARSIAHPHIGIPNGFLIAFCTRISMNYFRRFENKKYYA